MASLSLIELATLTCTQPVPNPNRKDMGIPKEKQLPPITLTSEVELGTPPATGGSSELTVLGGEQGKGEENAQKAHLDKR